MMGSVCGDWLEWEWLRGIQGDKGASIKFSSCLLLLSTMFATNNSNCCHTPVWVGLIKALNTSKQRDREDCMTKGQRRGKE